MVNQQLLDEILLTNRTSRSAGEDTPEIPRQSSAMKKIVLIAGAVLVVVGVAVLLRKRSAGAEELTA